jgi:SAM-dependent methyltransferase
VLERHKSAEIQTHEHLAREGGKHLRKPFGPEWGSEYWVKWATISAALQRLEVPLGSRVLDLGCGAGWTTLFLAESGFLPTGVDIAPAAIQLASSRAERWGVPARFEVADMEDFNLDVQFDAALVFDSLHHSTRPTAVVAQISRHLRPGGWVLFGEPSWLHVVSPRARAASRELGWMERGVTIRGLKRDCRRVGLGNFRRFYEGTRPCDARFGVPWQLVRLVAGAIAVAPQASVWLAAQRE